MVETPVLFITFVRPDYARQTWEGIKKAQPKTLYFYSNKGRAGKEGEIERNEEIRSYVNEIDWECDLHTWFREETANVYDSLRGAIDWLFNHEEKGIILEEDCVPTNAFFSFCDQLLEKYHDDLRVWCISGDNYVDDDMIQDDYYFSHYHYMYGWASWSNRWKMMDENSFCKLEDLNLSVFRDLYKHRKQVKFRVNELRELSDFINRTKCWDYMWGYIMDRNKALTIHPKYHLVTNIGLSGVHHANAFESIINKKAKITSDTYVITKCPIIVSANKEIDYKIFLFLQYQSFFERVISCLRYRIPLYYYKIFNHK